MLESAFLFQWKTVGLDGWGQLRGLPWELKPDKQEAPLGCQDNEAPALPLAGAAEPESTREFYVRRVDVGLLSYSWMREVQGDIAEVAGESGALRSMPRADEDLRSGNRTGEIRTV